jgi:DNA-directed RNA polymerase specialized sigma24 family protein
MFPIREADSGEQEYHDRLALVRRRILGFVQRRLVPREADFDEAEEIAQSCVVVLWEQYPEKREIGEMIAIGIGTARHKIGQFRRERARSLRAASDPAEASPPDLFEHVAAREAADRFLRAMLQLSPRCRELMRLKLVEQQDYAEIRIRMGISGNIYEMAKRCHQALLRLAGGVR